MGMGLVGCGGSDKNDQLPAGVVAEIGHTQIRERAVQNELGAVYASQGQTLKSFGPPNYPACVKAKRQSDPKASDDALRTQCETDRQTAHQQAIGTLVLAEQLAREARRRGINSNQVVTIAVGRLNTYARRQNPDVKPIRPTLDIRIGILRDKLLAAMPLSEAEIQAHGRANADVFYDSESRTAQMLQTQTKDQADKGRKQLDHGTPWKVVQNRYGIRELHAHWTGTNTVKEALIPHDAFGRSLFAAQPHKIIGPIRTLNGYFTFEVLSIRPPSHKGLTPQAHDNVAAYLRQQKLAQTLQHHYTNTTKCPQCSN
jgi:hypothetical protein